MIMKNLLEVSEKEQTEFIDSFDHVLTDLDGVLRDFNGVLLEGASSCLDSLRKIGKSTVLVTNNATVPPMQLLSELRAGKFTFESEEIFTPYVAVVEYLKKINYQRKICLISSKRYRDSLENEGFKIAHETPATNIETLATLLDNVKDDVDIGAVIFDVDLNLSFLKVQKASVYLQRHDCLFIVGSMHSSLPLTNGTSTISHRFLIDALIDISKKKPIIFAKPSKEYGDIVMDKMKILNPERVLFIGDSIELDMGFAATNGYKKLLVLTGEASTEDIGDWKYPETFKPNYYIKDLKELNSIIKKTKNV